MLHMSQTGDAYKIVTFKVTEKSDLVASPLSPVSKSDVDSIAEAKHATKIIVMTPYKPLKIEWNSLSPEEKRKHNDQQIERIAERINTVDFKTDHAKGYEALMQEVNERLGPNATEKSRVLQHYYFGIDAAGSYHPEWKSHQMFVKTANRILTENENKTNAATAAAYLYSIADRTAKKSESISQFQKIVDHTQPNILYHILALEKIDHRQRTLTDVMIGHGKSLCKKADDLGNRAVRFVKKLVS